MALPLPVAGESDLSPGDAWAAFRERRDALVARMQMSVCDGCDGCGHRCIDGFKVTREEYDAAQAYLAAQPPEEVARVLGQNKTAPWPGAEETGVTFTYCRYRDTEKNNCFIYPVRPTVSRLFGHTHWLPCPIEAVTRIPDGLPELWHEYMRLERRTWAEWDAEDL